MTTTIACRSSFARLASPQSSRLFAAPTVARSFAAARGRSPLNFLNNGACASSFATASQAPVASSSKLNTEEGLLRDRPPTVIPEKPATSSSSSASSSKTAQTLSADAASPQVAARPPKPPKAEKLKPRLVGRKAALTLTPEAVRRLRALLNGPHPQLIRIGVRNKGCAGMSYNLEYVETPGKFDEVVEQDGVRVLIDSKALFSIIGSEMDWVEDRLSAKFAFKNPNITDACGCGESFTVGETLG
ncbi:hypothetical protein DFH11DRAFT_1561522 [Phellopilus nigrolimitatus]|nr:hypothetical protein DFH11DRAFT_1561522 [Phellopilus nigrolimitatus]